MQNHVHLRDSARARPHLTRLFASITPLAVVAPLALGLAGCGAGPEPEVAIIEVTPAAIDPAGDDTDDLLIVAEYYDGDGDLGGGVAEIHDCRKRDVVTLLDIPAIASEEAVAQGVPIQGTMTLLVSDIGDIAAGGEGSPVCADLGVAAPTAGEAVFCVRLTDSAGNTGPGDCTDAIPVEPGS